MSLKLQAFDLGWSGSVSGETLLLSTDLLTRYRTLASAQLTVVDVETTGRPEPHQRVIEVSVLQASLEQGIHAQITHLINPAMLIPDSIVRFTGITQAMVDQALLGDQVWPQLLPQLQSGILTAHNLSFDYRFLQQEYRRLGIGFQRDRALQLCTVELARLMLPELPSRSLPALVQHFDLEVERSHRAAADTLACWGVAQRLLSQIQGEEDEILLARFGRQWIPVKGAAQILGVSQKQTRRILEEAGVIARSSRSGMYLYRRDDVEQIYWQRWEQQQPREQQLSLL